MVDIKQITEEVEGILYHSQDYPFDLNATNLINQWYEAKKPWIDRFGGKTIVRSAQPIKIYLSEEQRRRRFNEFLSTLDENGLLTPEFSDFLCDNEKGFFDNRVLLPYPSLDIHLGSKLSKSFKRFLPNSETIRWAQDTASRYIQENKIEGYLFLSVDPRDFLTLSENNEGWWSCQTLDGDYRAGNLSYMVDNSTVIAYLADVKQEKLKCLPALMKWNSKKWRMLIHTENKGCIYYNRQYPYESQDLSHEAHCFITKYLHKYFSEPTEYGFKIITTSREQTILTYNQLNCGGRVYDTRDVVDAGDYRGYCDLISSSSYAPIVSVDEEDLDLYRDFLMEDMTAKEDEDRLFNNMFAIKVGEKAICPCCGEEYIKRDDSFLCQTCIAEKDADEDFYLRCDSCYHHIYDEDEIFWIDDKPYCKACYREMQKEDINIYSEEEI